VPGGVGFTSTAEGPYSHRVVSGGDETFHVIALELLTPPPAEAALPAPRSGTAFELVMENYRGRAYRIILAPGESTGSFTRPAGTALFAVSAGRISEIPDGKPSRLWDFETADFQWFDTSETLSIKNEGPLPIELIEIEIPAGDPSSAAAVVGAWGLVSMDRHFEDGRVEPHMGEDPAGRLVYDEAGRMMVYLAGRDRAQFASSVRSAATPQELKSAFDTQISYFGTYSLDEQAGTVTHHVESAWYPNWTGAQQVRFFELEGDRLRLSTPPILVDGIETRVYLTWERLQ
ncbi:MAG: lipocalin-like domain-containing protein, partial [Balneolaceae bacterium]